MFKFQITLLSVIAFCLAMNPVGAHGQVKNSPKFIGFDFYPLGQLDKNNNFDGLFFDLMTFFENKSSIKVTKYIDSIPRAMRAINEGEYDLIISSAQSKALRKTKSLGVLGCSHLGVVALKSADIKSLADLKDRKIGFVTGGFLLNKFGEKFGLFPVTANHSKSMFRMLLAQRVEGIFVSNLIFDSYLQTELPPAISSSQLRRLTGDILVAEVSPIHLRMVKNSKFLNLSKRLEDTIVQALESGEIEKIFRKYGIRNGGIC